MGYETAYESLNIMNQGILNSLNPSRVIPRLLACLAFWAAGAAATGAAPAAELAWTDIRSLGVEGRGWNDTPDFYGRLPAAAKTVVRPPVWDLSRHSAGLLVRFVTDAPAIHARWAVTSGSLAMPHMPATGVSGLDLYVRAPGREWRWLATAMPRAMTNSQALVAGLPPGEREYLLYLPLYNGLQSAELGVPAPASLRSANPWGPGVRKPAVFYGTSIVQGGCASRPGMAHPAILGRRFNWPTINLGFSGNGRMEPELADLLAELDPAVYVLDCLPNMSAAEVAGRVEPFVRRLKAAHPQTPVVLVEDRTFPAACLLPGPRQEQRERRAALARAFANLRKAGVSRLYYVRGESLLGADGEATVDGSHPTDLGFLRQAETLARILKPLLKPSR
jgi:hypothetical protein